MQVKRRESFFHHLAANVRNGITARAYFALSQDISNWVSRVLLDCKVLTQNNLGLNESSRLDLASR
jgi:hypothetical protein